MAYNPRINKEISILTKNEKDDVGLYWISRNRRSFYGFIRGPKDSPFENGYWKLGIHLSEDYPFSPPQMKFMTKIYHPNISSQTGAICLDILKDKWTAAMNIRTTLLSIQALLTAAVPDDPQVAYDTNYAIKDYSVAVVYKTNLEEYKATARKWTELYAKKEIETEDEKTLRSLCESGYNEEKVYEIAWKNIWKKDKIAQEIDASSS